ncbi:MAG TPA: phosphoribosyl-AMP cyclohydrolase [Thermomicrobiales bacterium]|nr:phosphoribosyl-AMP cyclohydrolase [Thermomicrobiales bacterium]
MSSDLPIKWPEDGLIPAVIEDVTSGHVLMVGFMNETALTRTRETGLVHFWSRSREKLWKKGETSGHVQHVENIYVNCEQNSLLIEVQQTGAVCHDGYPTCYYRRLDADNSLQRVRERWFDPLDVYGTHNGVADLTRRWWGGYEFLREQDLESQSGTSRLLRNSGTSVLERIQDELRELAGTIDGSHGHTNQRDDIVLEASQVSYWTAVEAIRSGFTWNDVRPDRAFDRSNSESLPARSTVAKLLRVTAEGLRSDAFTPSTAHELFALIATTCLTLAVDPLAPILKDLEDLQTRDYLSPYFSR